MAEVVHSDFALFLDFDGTLVEIAERPDAVVVDPALPKTLAQLRDLLGGAFAVVSGRSISTLDGFLAPERFDAAGVHGVERRLAGERCEGGPQNSGDLRRAIEALRPFTAAHAGLLLEDKGSSFAVHWRLRPDLAADALRAVEAAASELGDGYRVQHGKAVAEILPAQAGKGSAIAWFLDRPPYRGRRPVFVGDDLTDEHGFRAVNERDGVSIRIGGGATTATHRLNSPTELKQVLACWADSGRLALGERA